MNSSRLLRLADHMEQVAKRKYDQNTFHSGEVSTRHVYFADKLPGDEDWIVVKPKEGFCGTSACVLGHAAFMEDMGLTLIADAGRIETRNKRRVATDGLEIVGIKDGGGIIWDEYDAAAKAFDIPRDHAAVLFGGRGNWNTAHFYKGENAFHGDWVSPQEVAAKLREYVETDGESLEAILQ